MSAEKENQKDVESTEKQAPEETNKIGIMTEKEEEAKLRAKYPNLKSSGGHSSFLQKRLTKSPKYFDSGDYNMAKSKLVGPKQMPMAAGGKLIVPGTGITGEEHPTPETVLQARKPSLVQSKLATDLQPL